MLAFSIDYYGIFFGATQSVELFCTYFAIDMDASFEQKKMCFLKLIDKERDFEHLKKISVVDIKSDSQIEKLSDRIIWTLEN